MNNGIDSEVVFSFAKNRTEVICLGLSNYMGKDLIFIRSFTRPLDGEGLIPTRKGVSLSIEKWPSLYSAIKKIGNVISLDRMIASIQKNLTQQIRISLCNYRETPRIDIRTYALFNGKEDYQPTRQGVSLHVELYDCLLEGAEKLNQAVELLNAEQT